MIFHLLLLIACACSPAHAQDFSPRIPQSDDEVLEHVPSALDPREHMLETLRRRWQQQPDDLQYAAQLSRAYIDYGRTTGDARYLGRALAVIAPWLRAQPPPLPALLVQTTILQSRHEFAQSRQILQQILERDPDNLQGWLTLAAVAQVQGDMPLARRSCAHLMGSMDALITAACIGGLNAVTGRAANAYEVIDTLRRQEPVQPPAIQSWIFGLLADAAKYQGEDARAELDFKQALQFAPGDNFLLADYADFLLDRGRNREVIALVHDYTASDTSFLRLVLAETALGLPQALADTAQMAQRFRDLEVRGDRVLYARESARFALDLQHDPARALDLAQEDWQIQRAPEDLRIYLEAALAAGRPQAAQPALDFLAQTHLEDQKVRALAEKVRQAIDKAPARAENGGAP